MNYPDTYLHVLDCKTGQEWIRPIRSNALLDLKTNLRKWVKEEFAGELFLDGDVMPKLDGDYYGKIMTDGRSPDSGVCWEGAGFYLTDIPNALLR